MTDNRNVKEMVVIAQKTVLSKAEREFIADLKRGTLDKYSEVYKRQLKHRILVKRKALTDDLVAVNEVLDKLQDL